MGWDTHTEDRRWQTIVLEPNRSLELRIWKLVCVCIKGEWEKSKYIFKKTYRREHELEPSDLGRQSKSRRIIISTRMMKTTNHSETRAPWRSLSCLLPLVKSNNPSCNREKIYVNNTPWWTTTTTTKSSFCSNIFETNCIGRPSSSFQTHK